MGEVYRSKPVEITTINGEKFSLTEGQEVLVRNTSTSYDYSKQNPEDPQTTDPNLDYTVRGKVRIGVTGKLYVEDPTKAEGTQWFPIDPKCTRSIEIIKSN